ncbi:MAG: hypothetical protein ACLPY2_07395 [Bryobacteraceae bacterium]|jgi:hypothetical protein
MRGPWLWAYALMSCAMCACSQGQAGRSFGGNWDDAKAREIAIAISSSWQYSGDADFGGASVARLQRNAYAILPFDKAGVSRRLVLVAVAPPDYTCHACPPVTGGVIFIGKDGGWEAGYDQAKIVNLGANGQPPKARLQQLGPALPALAFEMDSMAQGHEATTLTLVGEAAGKLKELLSLETAESNQAADLPENQTFRWQATLEFMPAPNREYPDIRVQFSGTRQAGEGKPLQPYSSAVTYRFSAGSYKPS